MLFVKPRIYYIIVCVYIYIYDFQLYGTFVLTRRILNTWFSPILTVFTRVRIGASTVKLYFSVSVVLQNCILPPPPPPTPLRSSDLAPKTLAPTPPVLRSHARKPGQNPGMPTVYLKTQCRKSSEVMQNLDTLKIFLG